MLKMIYVVWFKDVEKFFLEESAGVRLENFAGLVVAWSRLFAWCIWYQIQCSPCSEFLCVFLSFFSSVGTSPDITINGTYFSVPQYVVI